MRKFSLKYGNKQVDCCLCGVHGNGVDNLLGVCKLADGTAKNEGTG